MWKQGQFYYAVPRGYLISNPANWIVVQYAEYKGNSCFKKTGSSYRYPQSHFEYISPTPIPHYIKAAKAYKRFLTGTRDQITVNIETDDKDLTKLLNTLNTLKEEFEGNITLSDGDRQIKTQQVYSLMERISRKV